MEEQRPLLSPRYGKKSEAMIVVDSKLELKKAVGVRADQLRTERFGLYLQYFAVGILYGGLPATLYGLFLGYLNVPGYAYSTAATVVSLPWTWKLAFGALNDCFPVFGYKRKPYMVMGWTICAAALVRLSTMELPPPYWCANNHHDGYIRSTKEPGTGEIRSAKPCNASASEQGGRFAIWLMFASLGYCVADVAADGLTVTLARTEPPATRGQTQTTVYLVRTVGNIFAVALVGVCMNSWEYNGTFRWGLSFSTICSLMALPAIAMIPCSWFVVSEPQCKDDESQHRSVRQYALGMWELLRSKAMFCVVLYQFCTPMIGGISTTAAGEVKTYWAGVKTFQNSLFTILGQSIFAVGLWLVKTRFLTRSWRQMTLITTVVLTLMDAPFSFLTIFNIIRNQYFFLGEIVLIEIPAAVNFVVSTFVIVEMAEGGDEGTVYGLLTTTANLGGPVASAISNQLFGLFQPSLSNSSNYIESPAGFERTVAWSYVLSYLFSFLSLVTLTLLPDQKDHAQRRKHKWPRHDMYATGTICLVATGLVYSILANVLVMFPSTMCLRVVGGSGC